METVDQLDAGLRTLISDAQFLCVFPTNSPSNSASRWQGVISKFPFNIFLLMTSCIPLYLFSWITRLVDSHLLHSPLSPGSKLTEEGIWILSSPAFACKPKMACIFSYLNGILQVRCLVLDRLTRLKLDDD